MVERLGERKEWGRGQKGRGKVSPSPAPQFQNSKTAIGLNHCVTFVDVDVR